eukprot:COSAG01_NODE_6590_length_3589_cov_56.646421_3_plen_429_part_00
MATETLLSTLDNETQIRILGSTLKGPTNEPLTQAQKVLFIDSATAALKRIQSEVNICAFVQDNPNFLLDLTFPPNPTKHHPDGVHTMASQETYATHIITAFNCYKQKASNIRTVDESDSDELVSYNWLQHCQEVLSALEKRDVQPTTRHTWLTACRDLCIVLEMCDSEQRQVWTRCKTSYDKMCKTIMYSRTDSPATAKPSAKRKQMTTGEADTHCKAVSNFAVTCINTLLPKLSDLLTMNPLTMAKQLQKTLTMDSAVTGQQRKKLGIWFITSILALMKHGDVTDELTPDDHVTGDLRPLRTGDPFKMQFANDTSTVGKGSWILTNDESKQVFYSIIDSCTKNNHKTPPIRVPVHERCPLLAGFLLQWRKLMSTYQNTQEPYLLCSMSLDAAKRTPLFKTGDSRSILKWNSDTVRNYDQRVWLSGGN